MPLDQTSSGPFAFRLGAHVSLCILLGAFRDSQGSNLEQQVSLGVSFKEPVLEARE